MINVLKYPKLIIRVLLKYFGLELNKIVSKNSFLSNVYNTNFEKTVLISYLLDPFIIDEDPTEHTNYKECLSAGLVFHELGYNVDVVHLDDKSFNNYDKYSIIFGMGDPLENYFYQSSNKKCF